MRTVIVTAIGPFSVDIVIKKCGENGIRVISCDVYPREWIAGARSVETFYQVPYTTDTDHYIGTMVSLYRKKGVGAVVLLTNAEVGVFSLHRGEFSEINVTLCMSDKTCIGLCHNKMRLYRYLEKHIGGTAIPTLHLGDTDSDEIKYPAVCKPYNGRDSQDLKMMGSHREMEGVLGETDPADYIVRPMIRGNVVTVDVVRSPEQDTCAAICRRELLRTPNGAGISVLVFGNCQLEGRCRVVAGLLKIRRYANMEFVEDRDDAYRMLECNPRFSGGVEFSCLAGYDCVANHLRCFEGREIERGGSAIGMYIARKYEEHITKVKR